MTKPGLICAVTAAAAFAAHPAPAEDLTIVYQTSGQGGGGTATHYFTSDRMRTSDGQNDMIYEFADGKMIIIDHQKKEYSEISLAQLEAAMSAASAEMEKMSAQLENMPAPMREKMKQMMGGGGEVTLSRGGTRQIAGYTAQEYTITRGDSMEMQIWATEGLEPPASPADIQKMTSFGRSMAAMGSTPLGQGLSAMMEKAREIEGFPLADSSTFSIMGRTVHSSREATEVRKGPIPVSTFDVSAIAPGYEKVESPLVKAGQR